MSVLSDHQREFLASHTWAVLATGRRDGSPQQSMVGYALDDDDRLVISAKSHTAKWANLSRLPRASLCVPDGRVHLVVSGPVELIDTDPDRAELTADVFATLSGAERPDPASIIPLLDEQRRTIIRLTPERVLFHE